jgi:riboflavin synthase
MKDLQPFKNSLMTLTYEEKIEMSEWLHKQIEFEIKGAVEAKVKKNSEALGSFLDKAEKVTKSAGQSLRDSFNQATDQNA